MSNSLDLLVYLGITTPAISVTIRSYAGTITGRITWLHAWPRSVRRTMNSKRRIPFSMDKAGIMEAEYGDRRREGERVEAVSGKRIKEWAETRQGHARLRSWKGGKNGSDGDNNVSNLHSLAFFQTEFNCYNKQNDSI